MDIKVYEVMSRKFEKEILSAYIEKDNKKIQELEPFVYQPIELVYDEEGIEKTVKTEPCCNMIRFSVNEEGSYKLCVIFADNTDIEQSYTDKGYYGKGYIRINKNDKRYGKRKGIQHRPEAGGCKGIVFKSCNHNSFTQ